MSGQTLLIRIKQNNPVSNALMCFKSLAQEAEKENWVV